MGALVVPVLLGGVLPAAALFTFAWVLRRRERVEAPLLAALGAAFFLGSLAWAGFSFPPRTALQLAGGTALLAGLLAVALRRAPSGWAWAARGLFAVVLLADAARPKLSLAWSPALGALMLAGWAAVLFRVWWLVERRAAANGVLPLYLPLAAALGGAAALFFFTGSALLAQEGFLLAALVAAAGAALLFRRGGVQAPAPSPSVAGVAVPLFGLLAAGASWYSALSLPGAALLWGALAAPALLDRLLPKGAGTAARAAWGLLAALFFVAAAAAAEWPAIQATLEY